MRQRGDTEVLAKGLMQARVVWAAMLVSLAVYVFVGHVVVQGPRPRNPEGLELFRNILALVSAGSLIMAGVIRRALLGRRRPEPLPARAAVTRYLSATVATLALCESVGIYGLVLLFLSGDWTSLYFFTGASALAMIWFRPRGEELEELARG